LTESTPDDPQAHRSAAPRPGSPRIDPEAKRSEFIGVRVTPALEQQIEAAAERVGRSVSDWMVAAAERLRAGARDNHRAMRCRIRLGVRGFGAGVARSGRARRRRSSATRSW
jgi:hypothetical protein